MTIFFPGKWNKQTLVAGVTKAGGLRKKHPNMSIYAKVTVHHTDWMFVNKVDMRIGNQKKYTIASNTFDQRIVIAGDHILEVSWAEIDQDSDVYLNFWRPILNGNKSVMGAEVTTRIYGSSGHITYKGTI